MDDVARFVTAQEGVYPLALSELRSGAKRSHWMWFIFPQIAGLGRSDMARRYAIAGLDEADAYLAHPTLGPRLAEATHALLAWAGRRTPQDILGEIDATKFRSSMTLFEAAGGDRRFANVFSRALDELCGGLRDARTLALMAACGKDQA